MTLLRHSVAALCAVLGVVIGVVPLALWPAWRSGLRERLGLVKRNPQPALWVHAASAGEALAGAQLVASLRERGHPLHLSATTISGREMFQRAFPELPVTLAPLDHPWCVAAALGRIRPIALVLIETELWPSLIAGAARAGAPVAIASGRLSDRAYSRYRRLLPLFRSTLRRLSAVGARSEFDAERFSALGVDPRRLRVTGDLKLESGAARRSLAPELEKVLGALPLFVAGSTHAGEELAAEAALAHCEARGLQSCLVVAPRRTERATALRDQLQRMGRRVRLRSEVGAAPLAAGDVLLLDTLGELPSLYAVAALAFVGGTLSPVGGHNLLEPLHAGCPVLFGPHVANVVDAAAILLRSQAGCQVKDAAELGPAAAALLADLPGARARVQRGQRELEAHRGSAERSAQLVEELLARAGAGGE